MWISLNSPGQNLMVGFHNHSDDFNKNTEFHEWHKKYELFKEHPVQWTQGLMNNTLVYDMDADNKQ
jgi:hypothetical protein